MRREYPEAPIVGVGAVIVKANQVLLIQRGNEPNRGRWSIPGGTVELGETLAEAATREAREECQVEVEAGPLLSAADLILHDEDGRVRYHYVLIDLAARYVSGEPEAATDAMDVRWVREAELAELDLVPRLLPVLRKALQSTGTRNS